MQLRIWIRILFIHVLIFLLMGSTKFDDHPLDLAAYFFFNTRIRINLNPYPRHLDDIRASFMNISWIFFSLSRDSSLIFYNIRNTEKKTVFLLEFSLFSKKYFNFSRSKRLINSGKNSASILIILILGIIVI